ncbi:lysoplasmalogenase [Aestuariivivens insulae]|uniref:lysoplasmalogenase n=1 Tax=Aestuariivivens insulae TaxID=1621988 RepID=UPI001F5ACF16|nr:lysoplasmalogenase [Aestuariivivens insulae]
MLTKSEKSFSLIYVLILGSELVSSSIASLNMLNYVAKPAIVTTLIIYFYRSTQHLDPKTRQITLWALAFSVIGDVLLMFVNINPNFFIGGLISFLLGHLMYVNVFYSKRNPHIKPIGFLTILLLYAIGLFYILKDSLGDLLVPVIIYMFVILLMATMAYLRKNRANKTSFIFVFIGALCFIISDSLLALNKFYKPLPFANISIMVTYAIAQLCIVLGIKKQQ